MALRTPAQPARGAVRATDTLTIYLLSDDAIDVEATGAEAIADYFGGRADDASALVFKAGDEPTPATIRALTEHEVFLLEGEGTNYAHRIRCGAALGLVGIKGMSPTREPWCGRSRVSLDWLDANLHSEDVAHIGVQTLRFSALTAQKKTPSGS